MSLAAMGIYGVVAHSVAMRRHEIGIRMALGATLARVLRGFMSEGMTTAFGGALGGLAGAILLSRFLTRFLFGVSTLDTSTYAAGMLLLLAIAAAACAVPTVGAARVNPSDALRSE